jgi:hypothetical protein
MKTTHTQRWWIAINGSSCAMCGLPFNEPPQVIPRPQGLIGFPTYQQARKAQELCLKAPIPKVERKISEWRNQKNGIVFIQFRNPEPQTSGTTCFLPSDYESQFYLN